jgi:hypothetical protein
MADFCPACWGGHCDDLANLTKPIDRLFDRAAVVICEGCGIIQVDENGNCISPDCHCAGEPGHGVPYNRGELPPRLFPKED